MAATPSLRSSRSSSAVSHHPQPLTRALTSDRPSAFLQRTYSQNILVLEKWAEDVSQSGSDIGEEIRKMNEEQKARSRQSSIQSSHQGDVDGARSVASGAPRDVESSRSRGSSYSTNIVNVNGLARSGGYSPAGYFNSPVGSVGSTSGWSHISGARKASTTGSSRLAQMIEPVHEGRPLDSPLALAYSMHSASPPEHQLSRQASQSSFARQYDIVAGQMDNLNDFGPQSAPEQSHPLLGTEQEDVQHGAVTPPYRPGSADTFQQAQVAFKDFDGVHFSPDTEEFVEVDGDGNEVRRVAARNSSVRLSMDAASLLHTPRARLISHAAPPPADGMVYYPAPVPRMLNLPKRLSQLPSASVQAQRRSQLIGSLGPNARMSAPWLPELNLNDGHSRQGSGSQSAHSGAPRSMLNERMSVANLQSLPPQLRAGVYFDQQSVPHNVQIQSQSAVATLDNILAASATAPVNAFTDHPFAGDVRKSTFAPERPYMARTVTTPVPRTLDEPETVKQPRRRSTFGNLLRRSSSGDKLADQLQKRGSRASLLTDLGNEDGGKPRRRRSQISFGEDLSKRAEPVRTPGNETVESEFGHGLIAQARHADGGEVAEDEVHMAGGSRPGTSSSGQRLDEGAQIEEDFREEEGQEDIEYAEPVFVKPSTLLAELQVRKAQQKSRNRTAATHFPNGMHSTLLEMDAVEEINKTKRKKQRVPLAWEDPQQQAPDPQDEDDDVPLGVLFPGKDGLLGGKKKLGDGHDWDRPLGLMEKRELEDSEPLSSRRNRMLGLPPDFGRAERDSSKVRLLPNNSELHLAGQPDAPPEGEAEDEGDKLLEGETLAQRLRRLRTKNELDGALADVVAKDGSRPVSAFSDDLLKRLGGIDIDKNGNDEDAANAAASDKPTEAGTAAEEETLGQRRARLQREREIAGEHSAAGGDASTRPNLLRSTSSLANLLATNPVGTRKLSRKHEPAEGTLLHANAHQQAQQRQQILNTNRQSTLYGVEPHNSGARPLSSSHAGMTGVHGLQNGRAPTGGFAGGMYNNGMGAVGMGPASAPLYGMSGTNGYFTSPTAGMTYGGGMLGYGMQPPQSMMSPMAYQQMGMSAGYGFPSPIVGGYGFAAPPHMQWGSMGVATGMEDPMDSERREGIDRWRLSVAQ
ncbi:hypothetical protein BAUCODRAFT_146896 [Baudoinia panamericana UAMH 10762]|uniref:Uncharacterized protein n=1 Tax=Baudoinia panamericana (strain UAMH 10762) TaxID=717646 RepID=M2N319_BAUPA|nr:uncharacterized protein BAUCODRAFT_146896 [Baudoinia panamericana UAMH 10762]EMC98353.1 hypothetical protein BAUCODRAFT_146896 [Baudoinia panamericana UAMH 10762]